LWKKSGLVGWRGAGHFGLAHVVNLLIDKQDSEISPELKQQISDTILAHTSPSAANNVFTSTLNNLQVADESPKIPMPAHLAQVSQIYSNLSVFAALKRDKTVVTWGDRLKTEIIQATDNFSHGLGFTVKCQDGSITVWMSEELAVMLDKQAVELIQMRDIRSNLLDVIALMKADYS